MISPKMTLYRYFVVSR